MNLLCNNWAMPKKTSIHFLYENLFGRFFFNEEPYSIWTCCSNPYSDSQIVCIASTNAQWMQDEDADKALYIKSIPRCKLYRGLLLQGYLISPKFLRSLDSFNIRSNDLFICSYPRSGTTWTEEIVSAIASKMNTQFMSKPVHDRVVHLEVGRTFGQNNYLKSLKSPRILSTHLPYSHCPEQLKSLKCKVIYILRNPKDQAVSYYHFHHTAMYLGSKEWPFDQFIQLYLKGIMCYGSWFDHVSGWLNAAIKYPDSVLVISYEELQENLPLMIKLIASFLNVQLTDDIVSAIVRHCQFNSMKNNPAVNREETPLSDIFKASKFMRKGMIGDWKNYFNQNQRKLMDDTFKSKLGHFKLNLPSDHGEAVAMYKANKLRVFDPKNVSPPPDEPPSEASIINTQPNQAAECHSINMYINDEKCSFDQLNSETQCNTDEVNFHEINLNDEVDCQGNLLIGYRKRALQPNLSKITEEAANELTFTSKSQFICTVDAEETTDDDLTGHFTSKQCISESKVNTSQLTNHELITSSEKVNQQHSTTETTATNSIVHYPWPMEQVKGDSNNTTTTTTFSVPCKSDETINLDVHAAIASVSSPQLDSDSNNGNDKQPVTSNLTNTVKSITPTVTTIEANTTTTTTIDTVVSIEANGIEHVDNFGQIQLRQLDTTRTSISTLMTDTSSESNVNGTSIVTSSPAVTTDQSTEQAASILTYNLHTIHP